LKTKVKTKINEMIEFSKNKWNLDIDVKISYSLDSSRAVGRYNPNSKTIELNLGLLNEYKEFYINDTVIHEFCHVLVHSKYPTGYNGYKRVMPHGREFKAFCSWFGNDGKATTSLFNDSSTMKKRKTSTLFVYKCNCQVHQITKTRHNKIIQGKASYSCKNCSSTLVRA